MFLTGEVRIGNPARREDRLQQTEALEATTKEPLQKGTQFTKGNFSRTRVTLCFEGKLTRCNFGLGRCQFGLKLPAVKFIVRRISISIMSKALQMLLVLDIEAVS